MTESHDAWPENLKMDFRLIAMMVGAAREYEDGSQLIAMMVGLPENLKMDLRLIAMI